VAKLRVGIAFGGRSVEHEVSVQSAASIAAALDPSRYDVSLLAIDPDGGWHLAPGQAPTGQALDGPAVALGLAPDGGRVRNRESGGVERQLDVIFPIVHGTGGEDGCLQGALELADVPYVGSGVLGSALQMDKDVAKRLLRAEGLPVLPWFIVRDSADGDVAERARVLGYPCFVKPASLGSSVGTHRVDDERELAAAIQDARRFDDKVMVERAVDAREIEVAVLGNREPEASVPGEIVPSGEFYDYESKYVDEGTELIVPAVLPEGIGAEVRGLALRAFSVLEGAGLARVDFFLDKATDELWINELNSLPGFTDVSMYPRLWQASGLPYPALLDRLIELALARHRERSQLERLYRRG
jgi:D-alanine-D-alanine ligase